MSPASDTSAMSGAPKGPERKGREGRRALITGVTGQTGSYLAEALLARGSVVVGLVREVESARSRLTGLSTELSGALDDGRLTLVQGDLLSEATLAQALEQAAPDEVYNLAAQSNVAASWKDPVGTADITGLGALRLFQAVRDRCPEARVLQASTAAMFGRSTASPQSERTPFAPKSPYGVAKLFAHWAAVDQREGHGLHASCAILFNHESPRRGPDFVTRKITRAAARIRLGKDRELALGDLTPRRDWGHARDTVRALIAMLEQDAPGDFVIATGQPHTVEDFCACAFEAVDLDWREFVRRDERFVRPAELELLVGDASKAERELGWRPQVSFEELVREMVEADLARERAEAG